MMGKKKVRKGYRDLLREVKGQDIYTVFSFQIFVTNSVKSYLNLTTSYLSNNKQQRIIVNSLNNK